MAASEVFYQFDSQTHPSELGEEKEEKVVLLTLILLLNIKSDDINFSTPPLIFDVVYFRGAGPLRISSQKKMEHVTRRLLELSFSSCLPFTINGSANV